MSNFKAALGALALSACITGETVDPSQDMSALSAKEVADMVADMPSPRICEEVKERLFRVSIKYAPELVEGKATEVILADGNTRVSRETESLVGYGKNVNREQLKWSRANQDKNAIQETQKGIFTGIISIDCIEN